MTTALATNFDVGAEIARVSEHVNAIQHLIDKHMKEGLHYAVIAPGEKKGGKRSADGGLDNRPKPSLLKPGAELLCMMFKLSPEYEYTVNPLAGGHREYVFTCTIRHGGEIIGQGVGSCSSQEVKYRYRGGWEKTDKPIPKEYQELKKNGDWKKIAQLLGGPEYAVRQIDGAWCVARKGEKVENPDIADVFNTVLKMAKKRAMVDAILTATAASSVFTQDLAEDLDNLDDLPEPDDVPGEATPKGPASKPPAAPTSEQAPKQYASDADIQATIKAFAAKGVTQGELEKLTEKISAHWTPSDVQSLRDEYKRRGFAKKVETAPAPEAAADPLAELRKTVRSKLLSFSGDTARVFMVMLGGEIDKATEAQLRTTMTVMEQTTDTPPTNEVLPIIESVRVKVEALVGADKPAWANRVMEIFTGTMDYAVAGKVDQPRADEAVKFADTLAKLCERRRPKTMDDWIQAAESIVNGDSPAQEPWA